MLFREARTGQPETVDVPCGGTLASLNSLLLYWISTLSRSGHFGPSLVKWYNEWISGSQKEGIPHHQPCTCELALPLVSLTPRHSDASVKFESSLWESKHVRYGTGACHIYYFTFTAILLDEQLYNLHFPDNKTEVPESYSVQ